jgi:hypothetical protein
MSSGNFTRTICLWGYFYFCGVVIAAGFIVYRPNTPNVHTRDAFNFGNKYRGPCSDASLRAAGPRVSKCARQRQWDNKIPPMLAAADPVVHQNHEVRWAHGR